MPFDNNQLAWFEHIASRPGPEGKVAIDRLEATLGEKANGCMDQLVVAWLNPHCSRAQCELQKEFSWSLELMFESPAFIERQLDEHGPGLTEEEKDEICTVLLCRVGFLSQEAAFRDVLALRQYNELTALVRKLLANDFRA